MQTASTQFEHELKKMIAEEVDRQLAIISARNGVKNEADYNYYVGSITALRVVMDQYCDEAWSIVNKR